MKSNRVKSGRTTEGKTVKETNLEQRIRTGEGSGSKEAKRKTRKSEGRDAPIRNDERP